MIWPIRGSLYSYLLLFSRQVELNNEGAIVRQNWSSQTVEVEGIGVGRVGMIELNYLHSTVSDIEVANLVVWGHPYYLGLASSVASLVIWASLLSRANLGARLLHFPDNFFKFSCEFLDTLK